MPKRSSGPWAHRPISQGCRSSYDERTGKAPTGRAAPHRSFVLSACAESGSCPALCSQPNRQAPRRLSRRQLAQLGRAARFHHRFRDAFSSTSLTVHFSSRRWSNSNLSNTSIFPQKIARLKSYSEDQGQCHPSVRPI